jgi:hypothetical protein
MSKRFGRNQRRKLREALEQAQSAAEYYRNDRDAQARWNQKLYRRIEQIEREGFQKYLTDTGRLDALLEHMTEQLTARFGEELMPHVARLVAAANEAGPLLSFEAHPYADVRGEPSKLVIRGRLAPFSYSMVYPWSGGSGTGSPTRTVSDCLCIKCYDERFAGPPWNGVISIGDPMPPFRYACEICGNKRCPHHSDHRNACTGSNEPAQIGSVFTK